MIVSSIIPLTVPVVTPLALVVSVGCVSVLIPVAARTTVAPLMGFPLASFAVTVIVDGAPGTTEAGAAVTVDWLASTGPGVTVTVAVWVIDVPLILAETVLAPATVEARDPVATPLASVVAAGWVRVLPVPVAESTTVAPLIAFPPASVAVTEPADADTVESAADTPPPLPPLEPAALISTPSPPALLLAQVASTVLSF